MSEVRPTFLNIRPETGIYLQLKFLARQHWKMGLYFYTLTINILTPTYKTHSYSQYSHPFSHCYTHNTPTHANTLTFTYLLTFNHTQTLTHTLILTILEPMLYIHSYKSALSHTQSHTQSHTCVTRNLYFILWRRT